MDPNIWRCLLCDQVIEGLPSKIKHEKLHLARGEQAQFVPVHGESDSDYAGQPE